MTKIIRALSLRLIGLYKITLSPFVGHQCRFYPTCSTYTKQAIERFGVVRGVLMGAWRILRCNPWFGQGGYDPVPDVTKGGKGLANPAEFCKTCCKKNNSKQ